MFEEVGSAKLNGRDSVPKYMYCQNGRTEEPISFYDVPVIEIECAMVSAFGIFTKFTNDFHK